MGNITEQTLLWLVGMGYVSVLVVLIVIYVVFKSDVERLIRMSEGPLLPLMTVAFVVGATTLLALAGIVGEDAVAAIFGGIVGYVLATLKIRSPRNTPEDTS